MKGGGLEKLYFAFYASTRKCPNFFSLSFSTLFAALGSGSARRGFVLLSLSAAALPLPLSLSFFAGYQRSVDIVRLFRIVYAL